MWSDYINRLKAAYIGKTAIYEGKPYTIINVDINAGIWINKPHYYCESYTADHTAVDITDITIIKEA